MNTRKMLIAALVLSLGVASVIMYTNAMQNQNNSVEIAISFLKQGATFSYDGVSDTITVIDSYTLESDPEQHVVIISFDCTHAGYGDREGTFIAQIVTSHVIKVTIVEGSVIEAVIDEQWDELNQEQLIPEEYLELEEVRDIALTYVAENHQITFPETWISEVTTPDGLLGASTIQYTSGEWTVTISYPVVWHPDYTVNIQNSALGFTWSGTVTSSGTVTES